MLLLGEHMTPNNLVQEMSQAHTRKWIPIIWERISDVKLDCFPYFRLDYLSVPLLALEDQLFFSVTAQTLCLSN